MSIFLLITASIVILYISSRKLLSEKAKSEGGGDGAQINIQNNFSMQEMMTEGLHRIDKELDTDAKTV